MEIISARCIKYLMFSINLIFAILGLAVLALCVNVAVQDLPLKNIVDGAFTWAVLVVLIIGTIVFIISCFGCCGAIRENTCMLNSYSAFLVILLLVKVLIGGLLLWIRNDACTLVEDEMNYRFKYYKNTTDVQHAFAFIQTELKCCGSTGPGSYQQEDIIEIPASCCPALETPAPTCSADRAYKQGCSELLATTVKRSIVFITIIIFILLAVELLAISFSLYLAHEVKAAKASVSHYIRI